MRVVGGWTTCKRSKLNEGDCLKRVLIMCLMAFILSGCSKEEKPVSRAVFAWDGVVESDKQILGATRSTRSSWASTTTQLCLDIIYIFSQGIRPGD